MGRRWKVLLAGPPGVGKTTLCRTLLGLERDVLKTQTPEFHGDMVIDLPGEYVTIPRFRLAFLATAQDAEIILYVQAADQDMGNTPPGLMQTPPGVTLAGVVTKADVPGADVEKGKQYLRQLGIPEPHFVVCALDAASLEPLQNWIDATVTREKKKG